MPPPTQTPLQQPALAALGEGTFSELNAHKQVHGTGTLMGPGALAGWNLLSGLGFRV